MANIYANYGNGSTTGYYAVAVWAAATAYVSTANGGRGDYVRQLAAPAVGSERVFRCTISGTSGAAEPAWTLTKNAATTDNTATWTECTGQEADQVSGTWKAPHARLSNAFASTWGAAGDKFFVGGDHAETQATAMTLTSPGTAASPCEIYCVTVAAGTVPPVSAEFAATGIVATTGAASDIYLTGHAYCRGLTFRGTDGTNTCNLSISTTTAAWKLDTCKLVLNNTSPGSKIMLGIGTNESKYVELVNTTMQFGAVEQYVYVGTASVVWRNTASAIAGATFPTNLFNSATITANVLVEGVDLSALSTGKTLVGSSSPCSTKFHFKDCKLDAAVTIAAAPAGLGASETLVTRCSSSGINYQHGKYSYTGTQSVETTVVRTGGASDGTTPIAWNLTTTANSKWAFPFQALPIAVWNNTITGSITITVYGVWAGAAVPNNDDIWFDVEYLGSATSPQGSFATTTKADGLAANAATTADAGSTWGGGTTKFKITKTITAPAQKGTIYVYLKAAAVSSTFYIDPLVGVA